MLYIILFLFFISGACGLVYEVVWSREFVLVLGGMTHAVTAVVVAFMGGLALGSLWGGRMVDRSRMNPVLIYGLLEGGIGICALAVPFLIGLSKPLLSLAHSGLAGHPWLFELLRFFVSALVLFPPTLLMGATLPVLVRATLLDRDRFGLTAGRLYAINTLGAMVGAGLAGFVLLPALGNRHSIWIAVAANLGVCALVIVLRNKFPVPQMPLQESRADPLAPRKWNETALLVLGGYAISGMAALIYQIAWTRSLTMTLGGSTYSFSLILVAYISGLAIGGIMITPWVDRIQRPLLWAGVMEFSIGISSLLVLPILENINLSMFHWVHQYQFEGHILSWIRLGTTFGIVAVPTIFMGALLPLIARVIARERGGAGEPMGWVYSSNTAGAIVGAFLAGYVLVNFLGVRRTILFATGAGLAVGALWVMKSEVKKRTAFLSGALGLLLGLGIIAFLPEPDPLVINSGPYIYASEMMRVLHPGRSIKEQLHKIYLVRYFKEDAEATVSVLEERIDQWRVLRINGKTDASTRGDMPNQVLLAQIPLLLHRNPKSVMVLGLASGVTAGSALTHPIDTLDCLELSPAVVEACRGYFTDVNRLDFSDPRFHLIINDGRNHLELGSDFYDVIISEPSNPWQAAMSALFTREYFQLMRDHLNPDGIALAWLDVYNMTAETFSLVLRTFAEVFPYVTLWESSPGGDYIMLGSTSPIRISYSTLKQRCRTEAVAQDLARINTDVDAILARFVMDEEVIRRVVGPGPLHTDDLRQLEFETPRSAFSRYNERFAEIAEKILSGHVDVSRIVEFPDGEDRNLIKKFEEMDQRRKECLRLQLLTHSKDVSMDDVVLQTEDFLKRTGGKYPGELMSHNLADYLRGKAFTLIGNKEPEKGISYLEKIYRLVPDLSRPASIIARQYLIQGKLLEADKWARRALDRTPNDYSAMAVLADLARKRGDFSTDEKYRRQAIEVWPEDAILHLYLARSLLDQDKLTQAEQELNLVLRKKPDNADAHMYLGNIMARTGNLKEARHHLKKVLELDPDHPSRVWTEKKLDEML